MIRFRSTTLACVAISFVLRAPATASSKGPQDEAPSSIATVFLGDGTSVPLVEWKVTYEYVSWKQGETVQTARPAVQPTENLVLAKKTFPLKGATLVMTHSGTGMSARVTEFEISGQKAKAEAPAREIIAPTLDKKTYFQPRSLDIAGKTLSGAERSFCIASLSALVDCGTSESTRVVKVEFR